MKRLLILGVGFILCLPVIMAGIERNKPLEIAVVKEMGTPVKIQLETLKTAAPTLKTTGVVYNPAEIALKIWQGENPQDLKITTPRKVKLYISKTAADLLGITIPDAVNKKASEVF